MAKFAPLGVVLFLVLGIGTYLHGKYTDRFQPAQSELLDDFTRRIPELPIKFGDWRGVKQEIADKEFKATNCTAYLSAQLEDRKTGDMVSLYVVSGTGRHITIHSPDWCYQGAGYKMENKPEKYTIDCGPSMPSPPEFLTAVFRKEDVANPANSQALRIFWTYSLDGNWVGPAWAKTYYSGRPALYKIYIICNVTGRDPSASASIANRFAKEMLPLYNKVLFGIEPTADSGPARDQESAAMEENEKSPYESDEPPVDLSDDLIVD